jgi:L-asparaginase
MAAKVVLITTGGTISTRDSGKGAVVSRTGAELIEQLGSPPGLPDIKVIEFARVPGCEMTPLMMANLVATLEQELEANDVAGAVVTHGTDTIEESAFVAYLTVPSDKAIVFTGSMRTGSDMSWDGPRNLLDALKVAADPRMAAIGAMLVMNEEIHSARFVTKGNGLTLSTFHSPACGPLGRIYNGAPMLFTRPALTRRALKPQVESAVTMVRALSGEVDALGVALARPGLKGLVIDGFGSGRVPLSWPAALEAAVARGLPVVLASRTGAGAIGDPYGYGGAGHLLRKGLIPAHEMPAHKARLKLMVALGNGLGGKQLRDYFEDE